MRDGLPIVQLLQLDKSQRRLKTTFRVGIVEDAPELDGVADFQDLVRMMIGSFYQSRAERKLETKRLQNASGATFECGTAGKGCTRFCLLGQPWPAQHRALPGLQPATASLTCDSVVQHAVRCPAGLAQL